MKIFIIFIVICLGAWQFFLKDSTITVSPKKSIATEFSNSGAMQALAKAKELANPKD